MAYPATFADLYGAAASMTRLDTTDSAVASKVKQWVNETYTQVCAETRCLQSSRTDTLTASQTSLSLNSAVYAIELITCTPVGGTAWFPLKQATLDEVLNLRAVGSQTTGPPKRYALVPMSDVELWPAASGGETLTTWYAQSPTALSADSDVPLIPEPFASNTLIYGAAVKAAEWKRDLMMLGDFQQQYATNLAAFQRYVNRKAGAYPNSFPTWTRRGPLGLHDVSIDVPDAYLADWV